DFAANLVRAQELLETYRSRAKFIITTLLHCALPAIAMGIPVVVFYPLNDMAAHTSDRERFSSLEELVPIHRFDEIETVDWKPEPIDVSDLKLRIIDYFDEMAAQWLVNPLPSLGPLAPPSALPPPSTSELKPINGIAERKKDFRHFSLSRFLYSSGKVELGVTPAPRITLLP